MDLITDSKKLSTKKRETLAAWLTTHAQFALGQASPQEIDNINILQATFLAMKRAYDDLKVTDASIMIDGNKVPPTFPQGSKAIIGGDALIKEIAAASIIAKVYRDKLMSELAREYTVYGWEKNAGYGTKIHMEGLQLYGVTQHHRKSFAPVSKAMIRV